MNRTPRILSLTAFVCAIITTPAFAQTSPVETFNTYRGSVTHTGFVDTPISTNLALQWQFTKPAYPGNTSSPIATDKAIVYGLGKYVYAVSTASGAPLWQFPKAGADTGAAFNCPPAYADGKVFIGNDDGNLYAFDATTGNVDWQFKSSAFIHTSPIVVDGVVYFSSGRRLYAIDENTSKPVWAAPMLAQAGINTTPVVADGDVYVVDGGGSLYAANANSGKELWDTQVSGSPVNAGALVYDQNSLFFRDGRLVKVISGRGGDAKGELEMTDDVVTPITITDDGSYIVGTADLKLTSMDSHGRKHWTTTLDDFLTSPPLATRFHLFVGTHSGVIYELDRDTGAIDWTYTIQPISLQPGTPPAKNCAIYAAPIVVNHTLYVLSDDGTLSAFRENAPDNVQPVVTAIYPAPDSTVSGKQIPYQITVADTGSGVRPSSVALTVDGTTIPVTFDVDDNAVKVKERPGALGQPIALDTLNDGSHSAVLTLTDWRGNKMVRKWSFTVDRRQDALAANTSPVPVTSPFSGQSAVTASNTAPSNPAGVGQTPTQQPTQVATNNSVTASTPLNIGGGPAQPTQQQQSAAPAAPSLPATIQVPSTGPPLPPPAPGATGTTTIPAGGAGGPPPPPPI